MLWSLLFLNVYIGVAMQILRNLITLKLILPLGLPFLLYLLLNLKLINLIIVNFKLCFWLLSLRLL